MRKATPAQRSGRRPLAGGPSGSRVTASGGLNPYDSAVTGSYPYPGQPFPSRPAPASNGQDGTDGRYYRPAQTDGYPGRSATTRPGPDTAPATTTATPRLGTAATDGRYGHAARVGHTGTVPEGDVVWSTAQRLHAALAGQVLTRSDFRVPRYATVSLAGQLVTEATCARQALADPHRERPDRPHAPQDGGLLAGCARQAPGRHGPAFQLRLLLANAQWVAAGYLLGITEVLRTAQESQVIGHLGPDLLGADWDGAAAAAAVARLSREPERPIGEALLDQRNLAGLGTIFMAETLFLRGVDPSRPVGSVDGPCALVELGHRLLDANKTRAGRVTTGDARPGRESWVYGRAGRACRRCGTPVRKGEQGAPGQERLRFWCPNCQR